MVWQERAMVTTPISSVLSPAQIAILQQARVLVARPQAAAPAPNAAQPPTQSSNTGAPPPARGRGQIVNITV